MRCAWMTIQAIRTTFRLTSVVAGLLCLVAPDPSSGHDSLLGASSAGHAESRNVSMSLPKSAPMAFILAGEFAMGSDRGQDDEQPVHRVSVKAFYLDAQEVTVSRYAEFLASQKPDPPFKWNEATGGSHENKPVVGVNWYDARDYCRWVGKRLPTEAEWEIVANRHSTQQINLQQISFHPSPASDDNHIQQLFGQVWQWTQSPYIAYPGFYPSCDVLGEYNGKFMCDQWVLRGSSCLTPPGHTRTTYRNFFPSDARWQFTGLRLAADG